MYKVPKKIKTKSKSYRHSVEMIEISPAAASQDSADREDQPETVAESQYLLLKQKKYCDVTFTFQNLPDKIKAHVHNLIARSPVFERIFRKLKCGNVQYPEIEISDSTPEIFQQFLEFIYADIFQVNTFVGALDLLQLAEKYEVNPLIKKCDGLLKSEIRIPDSVRIFETARRYGHRELMERAGGIVIKSFLDLARMGALIKVEEETVVYLLECDDLSVPEVGLFEFIRKWGKNQIGSCDDQQALKEKLINLVPKVRYTNMSMSEFSKVVEPTGLLSDRETNSVYSYFRAHRIKRMGLNMKFNTVRRKLEMNEEVVYFYANHKRMAQRSLAFSKQYMSFKAERTQQVMPVEWSKFFLKKAVITGIKLMWPFMHAIYVEGASLNFKISLREFSGTVNEKTFTLRYEKILWNCERGASVEISVKPPVELIPEHRYSVVVEDLSTVVINLEKNFRHDPEAYYGFCFHSPNREPDFDWDDALMTLKEVRRSTNFYASTSPDNSKELAVILGMKIGLV